MRRGTVAGWLTIIVWLTPTMNTSAAGVKNPELPSVRARAHTETATAAPAPARPTLYATIDLSKQRMTVVSNGKRLFRWRISSGRRGYETPAGRFTPGWMAKNWHSRKYDLAPMPYSVFFNQGIATHGTTAVSRLGRPASHGCIRLATGNARRFYNLVRRHGMKKTRIIVKGLTKHPKRNSKELASRSWRARRYSAPRPIHRPVVGYSIGNYGRVPAYRPRRRMRNYRGYRY